ncbi:MAG: hypothetical protein CVU77_04095 [Elusimicrobia bacterium HGW-Elusimicrobia-1]|nr:MAG: hypothetical protein CVU77_04095 [Elusimicrobia bacterium HGW-Elusimicrobia-1]
MKIHASKLCALCAVVFAIAGGSILSAPGRQTQKTPPPPEIPGMVYVPDGDFIMGSSESFPYEGPQRRVFLDGYYIDANEVTNAQYKRFTDSTEHRAPAHWKNDEFDSTAADMPVVNVSYHDAQLYAKWAGKRLPTEAQWEKAARGSDSRKYPWGGFWQDRSSNVSYLFGLGGLKPIGILTDGKSPYGCYDMSGNAKEMTDSFFEPYPGCTVKNDKFGREYIVVRGGSYKTSKALATTYSRDIVKPDEIRPDIGFRCAK